MDDKIVRWTASFLSHRKTEIRLPGYRSTKRAINTGIPQGSPLSPVLFLFYNAEILRRCMRAASRGITGTGYIDDIAILATGKNTEETCNKLQRVHRIMCEDWAQRYGAQFAPSKYQLMHLSRRKAFDLKQPL